METAEHYRVLSETHKLKLAEATSLTKKVRRQTDLSSQPGPSSQSGLSSQPGSSSSGTGSISANVQYFSQNDQLWYESGARDRFSRGLSRLNLAAPQMPTNQESHAERIRAQGINQQEILLDATRPRSRDEMWRGLEVWQETDQSEVSAQRQVHMIEMAEIIYIDDNVSPNDGRFVHHKNGC